MENLNQEILELIAKHLKGETSGLEENQLNAWLKDSDLNKKAYDEFILIWDSDKNHSIPEPDVNKAWNKVKQQSGITNSETKPLGKSRSIFESPFLKIAASIVLVIGLLFLFKDTWFGKEQLTVITSGNNVKEVYLPDSSKVTLNKNSKVTYSQGYNEDKRIVNLVGEAFFEVKKDRKKPFIVLSNLSKTEVLGTAFNIVTGRDSKKDEIQVQHGRVSFSSRNEKDKSNVILIAGDNALLSSDGKIVKSRNEDENFLAWKDGILKFHNAKLEEVILILEKNYDVDIRIENDALNNCQFTGSFENASIEDVLKVVSVSINLSYEKQSKRAFLIEGKGCN